MFLLILYCLFLDQLDKCNWWPSLLLNREKIIYVEKKVLLSTSINARDTALFNCSFFLINVKQVFQNAISSEIFHQDFLSESSPTNFSPVFSPNPGISFLHFWLFFSINLPYCCKILRSYEEAALSYCTGAKAVRPKKSKIFFWSNPYQCEALLNSLVAKPQLQINSSHAIKFCWWLMNRHCAIATFFQNTVIAVI